MNVHAMAQQSLTAIIFDCYGVIIDNVFANFIAWKRLFEEEGVPFTMVDFQMKLSGGTREKGLRDMMGAITDGKFAELLQRKHEIFQQVKKVNPPELFPGVHTFLSVLRTRHIKTAVASASRNALDDLKRLHCSALFDHIVYPSQPGETSDKELFVIAMQQLRKKPDECIVIEDSPRSIRDAKELGTYVVGLTTSVPAEALHGADVIVKRHTELFDLLRRLSHIA